MLLLYKCNLVVEWLCHLLPNHPTSSQSNPDVNQGVVALLSTPKPPCKQRKRSLKDRLTWIDVDQLVSACEVNTWITNRTFSLFHEDKDILAAWLTSSTIAAAQSMLKEQHGSMSGLQYAIQESITRFCLSCAQWTWALVDCHKHWSREPCRSNGVW